MKVTHSLTGKVLTLPKYFTNGSAYFMIVDEKTYLKVYDAGSNGLNGSLTAYMKLEPNYLLPYENIEDFEHLSETEFKNAFLRVSLVIEETLNN